MKNIFDGIRVIDFTSNAAGPISTMHLADFGAEVIKIEKPKVGDDTRSFPPSLDGVGVPFFWFNRGKKSVAMDVAEPEGQEVIKKLAAVADIVVESFKPGTMEKYGLGYEVLKKINPKLIFCSVSAYGQTGPYSAKPGYDIVAQALSGVMDLTGDPSGPPVRSGIVLADYTAGIHAYAAIVSALYHRQNTGVGQYIDISLLDCMVSFNGLVESAGLGRKVTRTGNHHGLLAPFGLFQGTGGSVIIGAPNQKLWAALCTVMGKPELAVDPLFATAPERLKNLESLVGEIETWLKTFANVDEPLALIDKASIPCAKVNATADLLKDVQLIERGMITEMEMPDQMPTRKIKARGNPLKFSAVKAEMKKPPNLGQHEAEILSLLGYDASSIETLKNKWSVS